MTLPSQELGTSIPITSKHAISVTLPTWQLVLDFLERDESVLQKMPMGYPRFQIHPSIKKLCAYLEGLYAKEGEVAFVFPTYNVAKRCCDFVVEKSEIIPNVRVLQLAAVSPKGECEMDVVFLPESEFALAKTYWEYSGQGISSRFAEYVLYHCEIKQRALGSSNTLKLSNAKDLVRSRIADILNDNGSKSEHTDKDDIYLYPSGMSTIFNIHRCMLDTLPNAKSVCFGFPFVDTLGILKDVGPGVHFYGFGDDESLDSLEDRLANGERILGLFCECPSNPLLKTPNLQRLHELSIRYRFPVVVDDTISGFYNVDVRPYADVIVSSLTKFFSGEADLMAGSLILNKESSFYNTFKKYFNQSFEDTFWEEDAIQLEINSRDFVSRCQLANTNTEAVLSLFKACPIISKVFHPSVDKSKVYFDSVKTKHGSYGMLISIVFEKEEQSAAFYDALDLHKGPSLGTNFTLVIPFVLLAHYKELDDVKQWGVDRNLIRLSIGLENKELLLKSFQKALDCAMRV